MVYAETTMLSSITDRLGPVQTLLQMEVALLCPSTWRFFSIGMLGGIAEEICLRLRQCCWVGRDKIYWRSCL